MNNKFLVVANWKANNVAVPTWLQQFKSLSERLQVEENIEVAIAAPFPFLFLAAASMTIASQDISMLGEGAYTGETPGQILKELDVKYCLIGHSERRKYFGENNEIVEKKMEQALKNGITPILCAQSLDEIPENIRNYSADKYRIMYEPFSAISTQGQYHAEPPEKIAQTLSDWQKKLPVGVKFLYGGSINAENVLPITNNLITNSSFTGYVVGHASLDPNEFFSIINQCLQTIASN